MNELEPAPAVPDAGLLEYASYPPEVRQAALEHARGIALQREQPAPPPPAGTPQFVIVGLDGGTIIFSENVTEAKMVRRVDGFDRVPITSDPKGPVARVPRYVIALGVKLEKFEQHLGGDYPSALATLAAEWKRKRDGLRDREWGTQLPPGIT